MHFKYEGKLFNLNQQFVNQYKTKKRGVDKKKTGVYSYVIYILNSFNDFNECIYKFLIYNDL